MTDITREGTTMRLRILAAGGILAVTAALLVDHGDQFGLALTHSALLGLALGAVLGLVPGASPGGRVAGFAIGFIAAWAGYAARAGYLPDIPMGRAIAAFAVMVIVTAVAAGSNGRAPLWAGLLGVGALVGAYETAFTTMPTAFTTESVTAATTVVLAVAFGFLATTIAAALGVTGEILEPPTESTAAAERREIRLPGARNPSDVPTTASTKATS
ncbi:MAG: hypothetical protein QOK42_800 [Frankiaceae bacterium]|jgi:hypothetical protein|nr:hypothetical protein [Frankiaceae bacterium]